MVSSFGRKIITTQQSGTDNDVDIEDNLQTKVLRRISGEMQKAGQQHHPQEEDETQR